MTTTRTRRLGRLALAASTATLILAGGLVEPSGSGLRIDLAEGRSVEIGRWQAGSLWGAALAQSAQTVTLEDVRVTLDRVSYRMPRVVFEGASLGRAELAALFDTKAPEPLYARLARLSAQRIAIPEIAMEQATVGGKVTATYRDVVFENVAGGRIASGSGAGAAFRVVENDEVAFEGEHGRASLRDIDLAGIARIYAEPASGPAAELRTIYGAFGIENLSFSDGKGASLRIGRGSATDIRARQTDPAWGELSKNLAALDQSDTPSKEDQARILKLAAEMFGAMQVGAVEMTDLVGLNEEDKDSRFTIARMAYAGGGAAETRLEGLAIQVPDGHVKLGLLAFRGFSFAPVVEGLIRIAGKPEAEIDAADMRALVPTLGTTRMQDLAIDMPNEDSPGRNRIGVREGSIEAGPQRNGVPTSLKLAMANLTIDLTQLTTENGLQTLADLGYKALDVSWQASAVWREGARELAIDDFTLSGQDMGRLTLKAVASDVGPEVFSADNAEALVALLGASARAVDVTVQDNGLYGRLLAQQAKEKRRSADSLRAEYGAMATLGVPMALGGSAQARAVGEAVGRFLAKPGTLRVSLTPKGGQGLGVTELMSVSDPLTLLQRVDVKATTE
jgi:hypothetical protein